MNKEEALQAVLPYAMSEDWDVEGVDLSDPTFVEAMVEAGILYEGRQDHRYHARKKNGIFSVDQNGNPIPGLKKEDVDAYTKLGFTDSVTIGDRTITITKFPNDVAAQICDSRDGKVVVIGFVSPTRDTRSHWLRIPNDPRRMMMSFTTQIPGKCCELLKNIWHKGVDKRNSERSDFYYDTDVSQRHLASLTVKKCSNQLYKATRAQAVEMSFEACYAWLNLEATVTAVIADHQIQLIKHADQRSAELYIDGELIGEAQDFATHTLTHYTKIVLNENARGYIHDELPPNAVKEIFEWVYNYMATCNVPKLKKTSKTLKESKKTLKSLSELAEVQ